MHMHDKSTSHHDDGCSHGDVQKAQLLVSFHEGELFDLGCTGSRLLRQTLKMQ